LTDVREQSQVSYEGEDVQYASPLNYASDKVVQFCYDNGRIQKVWMDDADSTQLSNLKRAILSHLQLSIDSLELPTYTTESDISGRCLTEFHPVKEETKSVTIMKTKYTTGCTDKYVFQSPLANYEIDAPTQSSKLPHVTGIMQCEIQLKPTQEIQRTSCNEALNITSSSLMQNSQSVVVRTITEIRLVRKSQSEKSSVFKTDRENPKELQYNFLPSACSDRCTTLFVSRIVQDTTVANQVTSGSLLSLKRNCLKT
ncbi:hypothetical protein X801_00262, partial [Opisthorchis viverrini]